MVLGSTLSGAVLSRPVGSGGVAGTHSSPVDADSGPGAGLAAPSCLVNRAGSGGLGGGGRWEQEAAVLGSLSGASPDNSEVQARPPALGHRDSGKFKSSGYNPS